MVYKDYSKCPECGAGRNQLWHWRAWVHHCKCYHKWERQPKE